jgi:hypothetical protein
MAWNADRARLYGFLCAAASEEGVRTGGYQQQKQKSRWLQVQRDLREPSIILEQCVDKRVDLLCTLPVDRIMRHTLFQSPASWQILTAPMGRACTVHQLLESKAEDDT